MAVSNPAQSYMARTSYAKLPVALWALFVGGAVLGLATPNPLLTPASIILLPVFMTLLWRPGETPVLLFVISFQWLQVTARVFHANVLNVEVAQLSQYTVGSELPSVKGAIWLSLLGLLVLAIGMRWGMRRLGRVEEERASEEAMGFSTDRAFLLYVGCTVLASVLEANAWSFGGLIQVVRAAAAVKWIGFFLFGYIALKRRERLLLLAAAIAIEFLAGIGFFSGFKTVIFLTLILVFTVHYRLKAGTIVSGLVLLTALVIFGAGWTSIKGEFRAYLNQGTSAQATLVTRSEQFDKLIELIGDVEGEDLSIAVGDLFGRIAYVDYFALSMGYVPDVLPYEGGELWKQSIMHTLTPRVFFPNKPVLPSDSEMTMRYTGLYLASGEEGTSISIGYMGESYIDFGPYGMFVPIFLLGVLWGLMYYYFLSRARFVTIGYAFATALLVGAYQFEMTGLKLFGGMVMGFLVLALILRFTERHIGAWLQGGGQGASTPVRELAYDGG